MLGNPPGKGVVVVGRTASGGGDGGGRRFGAARVTRCSGPALGSAVGAHTPLDRLPPQGPKGPLLLPLGPARIPAARAAGGGDRGLVSLPFPSLGPFFGFCG